MRGKQEAISGTTPIWISAVSVSSDGFAMEWVEVVTSSEMKGKRREIRVGAHGDGVLVNMENVSTIKFEKIGNVGVHGNWNRARSEF